MNEIHKHPSFIFTLNRLELAVAKMRFPINTIDFFRLNLPRTIFRAITVFLALMVFAPVAQAFDRQPVEGYNWQGELYRDKVLAATMACRSFGSQSPGYDHIVDSTNGARTVTVFCKIYASDLSTYPVELGTLIWMRACPDSNHLTDGGLSCPSADEKKPQCPCNGNPISLGAGSKTQAEKDYSTEHGLEFTRYYSNLNAGNSPEMLTNYWRHSYSKRLVSTTMSRSVYTPVSKYSFFSGRWYPQDYPAPPGKNAVRIYDVDGYGIYFESDGAGGWVAEPDVKARLTTSAPDAYGVIYEWTLYKDDDSVEKYNVVGQLVSQRFRSGIEHTLTYSREPVLIANQEPMTGQLIQVRDNFGAKLQFVYDSDRRLSKMIDAAGQEYSYEYAAAQLVSVTKPDGLKVLYHYNEPSYSTGEQHGYLLTGISREISPGNMVRYATYQFSNGVPISTEHAGGVEKYSFDYGNNLVIDPLGPPVSG